MRLAIIVRTLPPPGWRPLLSEKGDCFLPLHREFIGQVEDQNPHHYNGLPHGIVPVIAERPDGSMVRGTMNITQAHVNIHDGGLREYWQAEAAFIGWSRDDMPLGTLIWANVAEPTAAILTEGDIRFFPLSSAYLLCVKYWFDQIGATNYCLFRGPYQPYKLNRLFSSQRNRIDGVIIFCEQRPIGIASWLIPDTDEVQFDYFIGDPRFQRQGIGSRVLRMFLPWLQGYYPQTICLTLIHQADPARAFYEHNGLPEMETRLVAPYDEDRIPFDADLHERCVFAWML